MSILRRLRLYYLRFVRVGLGRRVVDRPIVQEAAVAQDINLVVLAKGAERFVILYAEDRRAEALRQLGRWASSPELAFSWADAAVLSQRIRQQAVEAEASCAGVKVRIVE